MTCDARAAHKMMCERVVQLVLDSFNDQFYPKAMDCLRGLRAESIKVAPKLCAGDARFFNFTQTMHVFLTLRRRCTLF
jgi:hypothetical protein